MLILSRTHTHATNTRVPGDGLVEWEGKNDRSVCRREEVGFQFWLKRRERRWMPDRERKRVPDHRPNVMKGSLPKGPPAHPRNTASPSIRGWYDTAVLCRQKISSTADYIMQLQLPSIKFPPFQTLGVHFPDCSKSNKRCNNRRLTAQMTNIQRICYWASLTHDAGIVPFKAKHCSANHELLKLVSFGLNKIISYITRH